MPVRFAGALVAVLVLLVPAGAAAAPHRHAAPPSVLRALAVAKPKAKLRVSGLPRRALSATTGRSLVLRGRVRNLARHRSTPTISVFLARARLGRVAIGSARVGSVAARRRARFSVRLRVPSELAAGAYRLKVCARVSYRQTARCTTAPKRLRLGPGLALGSPVTPVPPAATPTPAPSTPQFTDGARSVGDSLFPQIGNGGYDAQHYALALAYEPSTALLDGTSTMTATATQDLRSFSLDLQGLEVRSVTVDGVPAFFEREATKLIVTPAAGIAAGRSFSTAVTYGGVEQPVVDPDDSIEGWIPTDTGAVVVCEPLGAQGWFPNDNTPRDKATFDVTMTIPRGLEVLGNGVLESRVADASTERFHWVESRPMATYLSTATIGDYDVEQGTSAGGVPLYSGIDLAANTEPDGGAALAPITPAELATVRSDLQQTGPVVDFFGRVFGAYPFESSGAIVANAGYIGYQLEVQGRPVYVDKSAGALTHELVHQWFGDNVSVSDWRDLWLAEGFATWSPWYYDLQRGATKTTPAQHAAALYAQSERTGSGALRSVWKPAVVQTAADVFGAATYDRGAMLIEALRQRIGDPAFFQVLRDWQRERGGGNGTSADFAALAERDSGQELGAFFDDWLYTTGKPTTTPPVANP